MSVHSLKRQLVDAEAAADNPKLSAGQRRGKLVRVESLRVQIAKLEAREARQLEERGQRASRW